jgi:hypothetical protein
MTPERAAAYAVGDIYKLGETDATLSAKKCFEATPQTGKVEGFEILKLLEGGLRLPLVGRIGVGTKKFKKQTFGEPYADKFDDMDLESISKMCRDWLLKRPDLGDLYLVKSVLMANMREQVCDDTTAGISTGGVGVEGRTSVNCVSGTEGHVAVGYKLVPVQAVLGIAAVETPAPRVPSQVPVVQSEAPQPATVVAPPPPPPAGQLSVDQRLKEQACTRTGEKRGKAARQATLSAAVTAAQTQARLSWAERTQSGELERCTKLPRADRTTCITSVEQWLTWARALFVTLSAGEERVRTDCGERVVAYPAAKQAVAVAEISKAEALFTRLKAAPLATSTRNLKNARFAVFEAVGKGSSAELAVISDQVRVGVLDALRGRGGVVMSRENIAVFAREMGIDLSTCTEAECEVDRGRSIGARYVVAVSVSVRARGLSLTLKFFDTETGALLGFASLNKMTYTELLDATRAKTTTMIKAALE